MYLLSASLAMLAEMSEADTAAPRRATGTEREPVPQPQSANVVFFTPPSSSSHLRTFSTVWAWPFRMSSWTLLTSSVSP